MNQSAQISFRWATSSFLRAFLAMVVLGSALVLSVSPAEAVGETLAVVLTAEDGTPDFDTDDLAGHDSGLNNGIVRTNDLITYHHEISVNDGPGENVTFTLALARGTELVEIPPYCGAGSSVTPASLPDPVNPITVTSWQALQPQNLVCNVGARTAGSTFSYPVLAKVRSEMPNGEALDPVSFTAASDAAPTPVSSGSVAMTVSARAQIDLSKNSIREVENTGYINGNAGVQPCADGSGRQCFQYGIAMLLATPTGGKGTTPLASPVVITDDLSPAGLYGAAATSDADYIAAGAGAIAKYGAILVSCAAGTWQVPGGSGGGEKAVRNSGSTVCTQPGGPGSDAIVSITGMDSTAHTYPTLAALPADTALPANRAYIYSRDLRFQIPFDAVRDLGTLAADGATYTMPWDNKMSFTATSIDGTPIDPAADALFNNHRASSSVISSTGSLSKLFTGVPGMVGNTPPVEFNPGNAQWEGPAGSTGVQTGDGQIYPGGQTISALYLAARTAASGATTTFQACDTFDPSELQLMADNYPASSSGLQTYGSGGAAVWLSGVRINNLRPPAGDPSIPVLTVEYGTGAFGPGVTCNDGDSPSGWASDPAAVPGNDLAELANGVYTAISKVRVHVQLPAGTSGTDTLGNISIGQRVVSSAVEGQRIGNWASSKVIFEPLTAAQINDSATYPWRGSDYNESTNTGNQGDRLTVSAAVVRMNKEVRNPNSATFGTTTPSVTGGQTVDYRLNPSLGGGATAPVMLPVVLEDCLPAGQTFVSSTPLAPALIQSGAPAGSELVCAAPNTYVRWDLGPKQINQPITPVEYKARMTNTIPPGTYINKALVSAQGDRSPASRRADSRQVIVIQPAGIKIDKIPLTPLNDINRPTGDTDLERQVWKVEMANFDIDPGPTDIDIIDRFPVQGLVGTDFDGTLEFETAVVTEGGALVQILYTSAATVELDPNHSTNSAAGATVWCDAPAGGNVVIGTGGTCPTNASAVSGLRVRRPGPFASGDVVSFELTMLGMNNNEGDVYVNSTAARASGLQLIVGPVNAEERIQNRTPYNVGDRIWYDYDGDGIQDPGEPGINNVQVQLLNAAGDVIQSRTTSGDGDYLFPGVLIGDYTIRVVPASLPANLTQTGDPDLTKDNENAFTVVDSDILTKDFGYQPPSDVALSKAVSTSQVSAGETVAFTLSVANESATGPATNIAVGDVIPAGYTYVADTIGSDAAATGATITHADSAAPNLTWVVDRLDPGETVTLTFNATVLATVLATSEHLNVAQVTAMDQPDIDSTPNNVPTDGTTPEDDEDSATVAIRPNASIDIEKATNGLQSDTAPGAPIVTGAAVTWTYVVTNTGSTALSNIKVSDSDSTVLLTCDINKDGDFSNDDSAANPFTAAFMAPGASLTCQASGTAGDVDYENIGSVSGDPTLPDFTPDPTTGDPGCDCDPADPTTWPTDPAVYTAPLSPEGQPVPSVTDTDLSHYQVIANNLDLALTKTLAANTPTQIKVGDQVTFLITVTNEGGVEAIKIGITDTLPAGMTLDDNDWKAGSNNTANYTIAGRIAPGKSETVQITVRITATGSLTNLAEISTAKPSIDGASLPTDVIAQLDDIDSTPGNKSGTEDDEDAALLAVPETTAGVTQPLAFTGGNNLPLLLGGLSLLLGGLILTLLGVTFMKDLERVNAWLVRISRQ